MVDRRARSKAKREAKRKEKRRDIARQNAAAPSLLGLVRQDPLYQVAAKQASEAMHAELTPASVAKAAASVETLLEDRAVAPWTKEFACKRGCSYCCQVKVDVTIPELERLVAQARATLTEDQLAEVQVRARVNAAAVHGKSAPWYCNTPCAFLRDGECISYDARPLACRQEHSPSVEYCRQSAALPPGQDINAPRIPEVWMGSGALRAGFEDALRKAGLDYQLYELQESAAIALEEPDAMARWVRGEDVFASSRQSTDGLHGTLASKRGR